MIEAFGWLALAGIALFLGIRTMRRRPGPDSGGDAWRELDDGQDPTA
ncbi:MAG: hypothetical protein ACK5KO_01245 [Arachnia sp.]